MDIHGYPWISTQNRPGYGYGCDYSSPRQAWVPLYILNDSVKTYSDKTYLG